MPTSNPASDETERLEALFTRENEAASGCTSGITGWGSPRRSFQRGTPLLTRLITSGERCQTPTSVFDLVEDLRANLQIDLHDEET